MESFITWDILLRKVHQELTPAEETLFQEWLVQDERHRIYFDRLQKVWSSDKSTSALKADIPGVKARFDEYIRNERRLRRRMLSKHVYRYAACCLLLLALGTGVFWFLCEKQIPVPMAAVEKTLQPGDNKAIILLSDGKKVDVALLADTSRYKIEGLEVEKEKGIIHYVNSDSISTGYHTVIIPKGGEYQVSLGDGTKIWLNSETQLKIPTAFVGRERRVFLSGEAYFEVAKDERKPFIVETDLGKVKVYGTEFNIKRYPDEEYFKATLVEGSIGFSSDQVTDLKIRPGEQLSLAQGRQIPEVKQVKVYNEIAWKNRQFCFESQTLDEIMTTLQRWYDVDVIFMDPALKELKFSGTLNRFERIEKLLHLFEAGADIKFRIDNDKIKIMRK